VRRAIIESLAIFATLKLSRSPAALK